MCISTDYPIQTENLPESVIGYKVVGEYLTNWFTGTTGGEYRYRVGKTHRTKRTPPFSVLEHLGDARGLKEYLDKDNAKIIKVKLEDIERKGLWLYFIKASLGRNNYHLATYKYSVYEGRTLTVLEVVE